MINLLLLKKDHRAREYWSTLLWNMAGGDKTQYDSLRNTEVIEFFYLFKTYAKNIKAKRENIENTRNGSTHKRTK